MNALRRFIRDEAGGSLVEFALVFTFILLPLLFGAMEFGRGLWIKSTVTAAAREGVRYAIVRGFESGRTISDTAQIRTYIEGRTALSPIAVATTYPQGNLNQKSFVKVTVSYAYTPVIGGFNGSVGGKTVRIPFLSSRTISSSSQQVIAY